MKRWEWYLHVKRELHLDVQVTHEDLREIFNKRLLCHVFLCLRSFWVLQVDWCLFREARRILLLRLRRAFETCWTACRGRLRSSLRRTLIVFLLC